MWYTKGPETLDLAYRMGKKARMGRPPKPKSEQKRHFVGFKLDDADLAALKRKAKSLGLSLSDTIRDAVRRFVAGDKS